MVTVQKGGQKVQAPATSKTSKAKAAKKAKAAVMLPPVFWLEDDNRKVARAFRTADSVNIVLDGTSGEATLTFIRVERVKARKNDPWATSNDGATVERKMQVKVPGQVRTGGRDTSDGTWRGVFTLPDLFATAACYDVRPGVGIRVRVQVAALGEGNENAMFVDCFNRKSGKLSGGFIGLCYLG